MGPVVRTPVSANPGLNFNPGFFFLLSKAHCRIFSLFFLEYPITKLKAKRIKLNLPFKLSYPSSNFTLTVGYLNPASNNPALGMSLTCFGSEYRHCLGERGAAEIGSYNKITKFLKNTS